MRELNVMEINAVSGAGIGDALFSGVVGFLTAVTAGAMWGTAYGGEAGGLLGVGAISGLAGMLIGVGIAATMGTAAALFVGWDNPELVMSICTQFWTNMSNGTFIPR